MPANHARREQAQPRSQQARAQTSFRPGCEKSWPLCHSSPVRLHSCPAGACIHATTASITLSDRFHRHHRRRRPSCALAAPPPPLSCSTIAAAAIATAIAVTALAARFLAVGRITDCVCSAAPCRPCRIVCVGRGHGRASPRPRPPLPFLGGSWSASTALLPVVPNTLCL